MKHTNKSLLSLYIIGFCSSIILTLAAYVTIIDHLLSGFPLVLTIMLLALIQLVVQLFCFLHLGQESKPRWNLAFFISTIGIIVIVVVGSIWIMTHLNYNMNSHQIRQYIKNQDGI